MHASMAAPMFRPCFVRATAKSGARSTCCPIWRAATRCRRPPSAWPCTMPPPACSPSRAPTAPLVACDCALPELMAPYADADEQPHAWAWLMTAADSADTNTDKIALSWTADDGQSGATPGSLDVLAFQLGGARVMERVAAQRRWRWSRDAFDA